MSFDDPTEYEEHGEVKKLKKRSLRNLAGSLVVACSSGDKGCSDQEVREVGQIVASTSPAEALQGLSLSSRWR